MELKEKIRDIRKSVALSQEKFAEKLNTSFMTIRRWENGTISPRFDELQKISEVFNIPLEKLINTKDTQQNFGENGSYIVKVGDISFYMPINPDNTAYFKQLIAKTVKNINSNEIQAPIFSIEGDHNNNNQLGYMNLGADTLKKEN